MRRSLFLFLCVLICTWSASAATAQGYGNPLDGLAKLKDFEAARSSSSDADLQGNADARPIEPGATLTIADLQGPGQIVHIWCTISARDKWYPRTLVLRTYWDGEKDPSVESPLGDFFAVGHGLDVPVNSLPVRVTSEGRARHCYWPMPFRKSARITVTNEGKGRVDAFYYYVDWQKHKSLPKNTAYFHAQYRQEFPPVSGHNYLILDAIGQGHYVGTVQSVRLNEPGWYGEGDDFFFVDGATDPQLKGTGTEDYFGDAWGFRKLDGPYYGVPVMQGYDTGDLVTAYRWHIPDPIPFKRSLRVEIEHKGSRNNVGGYVERADDFATVAFWYQIEPHKKFAPLPPAAKRLLFEGATVVEMEKLVASASTDAAAHSVQVQSGVGSGEGQLFFTPGQPDKSVTVLLPPVAPGAYEVRLTATTSFDYGIYQTAIDARPTGPPLDLFSETISHRDLSLGRFEMGSGQHKMTFTNKGRNAASKGYYLGLDTLILRPIK